MSSDKSRDAAALMKRSLLEVRRLRGRIADLESAANEPIAIVGLGCRFPGGAGNPERFWELLLRGEDAIVGVPPSRWDASAYYDPDPTAPGKVYVREGGFLEQIEHFDAHFFGISVREAMSLDPQQRILLEVAWEALEYACQAPDALYGTKAGVFVGVGGFEYAAHLVRSVNATEIDPHFGTGTALSAAAGRLSFTFGLTGPSMAIDTACSSSLVAVHIACQSLRHRECDLALAGGVNVMIAPEVNIAFSKARLLSPDGRCRTFDAAADGYGRGEGCGLVVLKRLSDATAHGDPIVSIIRGSAVNQDGPSGALVVPNGLSQQAVIRTALENATVSPNELDYIEAHGTGTSLGDPIEVGALGHVFGRGREADRPLVIGSVKTNLGHLESAAGIAGLIKVALSLRHETIPAHLHFRQPNPRIPWDLVSTEIPTEAKPWPRGTRRRVAGVSSFGFTGTNAHVVLEEAPAPVAAAMHADRGVHVFTLSAKTHKALRDLAARFEEYAGTHPDAAIGDVCFSVNVGRARLRHRLAIVATSMADLRERIGDFLAGRDAPGLFQSDGIGSLRPKTAFLFTPPGADYPEMGRELYETHPGFRETYDRGGRPPLVALQTALAELWKSWGAHPAAVWPDDGARRAAIACEAGEAADAIRALHQMGCRQFIEIGPEPVLLRVVRDCLPDDDVTCIPSLRRGRSDWRQLAEGLALLSIQDRPVDWRAFDRYYQRRRIPLPLYPFQRERYWFEIDRGRTTEVPSDLFYRIEWQAKALEAEGAAGERGTWLILSHGGSIGEALAEKLRAEDQECIVVSDDAASPREILERVRHLRGVVYLCEREQARPVEAATQQVCAGALRLVQALAAKPFAEPPRLWLVTHGAQSVAPGGDLPGLAQATLWGLGAVVGVELPQFHCTLVDLDPSDDAAENARQLFAEMWHATPGESCARRGKQRYVPRLVRGEAPGARRLALRPDGRYLITGGLGGIGLRLARWLASAGARRLILVGRSEPTEAALGEIQEIRRLGANVVVMRADVSRADQLASLPPLAGVVHCAGTFQDRMLEHHRWDLFEAVFAPKVLGAWNLHALTLGMELDFFVLFSSSASMLPAPGMGAYAAANAFEDALAHYRRSQGLPALSVSWGPWEDVGMAQRAGRSRLNQWRIHGLKPLAPAQALEAFGRLLHDRSGHVGVFSVEWPELTKLFTGTPVPPYLEHVAGEPKAAEASTVFERLRAMQPDERARFLESYLKEHIGRLVGPDAGEISTVTNLPEAGVDSLMIMDVLNTLRNDLRFMLYPREFYEQPTIGGLARYLASEFERTHGQPSIEPAVRSGSDGSALRVAVAPPRRVDDHVEPLAGIGFILSGPRAGSTLLRVMLAGHPALFSPPELHLLPFSSMAERSRHLGTTHLGEGLQRAVMALASLDAEASRALIERWVEQDLSIREVYATLQTYAGDRLLVDKSPTHAASADVLARAERLFRGARYIHLARHPYAAIESFVRLRMDKLAGIDAPDPYRLAEEIWTATNRNILDVVRGAAPDRYHLVFYEELVRDPRAVLTRCCEFLGVPFDEAVLEPYSGARMTDGVHAVSAPIGDPDFLRHEGIDARLGETWKHIDLGRRLGPAARAVAAELGYDLPRDRTKTSSASHTMTEASVETPRGLRLCLCRWGPAEGPAALLLHGVLSQGASWMELAEALAEKGIRAIAPDLRGHGRSDHVGRGGSYHVLDFVADLDAVAAQIDGGPFVLVGHSMGAAIAALFAAARPGAVASLVLVEPLLPTERQSDARSDAARLATQLDALAREASHPTLPDVAAAASRLLSATPGLPAALALKLAERDTVEAGDGVRWRWDPLLRTRAGIAFGYEHSSTTSYVELLKALRPPLTIVIGSEPALRRRDASFLEEAARCGATIVRLAGGHNVHLEQPFAVADIVARAAARSPAGAWS